MASSLLIDEFFTSEDERFLSEVLASTDAARLKGLGIKWAQDRRPFARDALQRYLLKGGADRENHRPLVKQVLKAAEKAQDDELMGWLMIAFDRLQHRVLVDTYEWDPKTRTSTAGKKPKLIRGLHRKSRDKKSGGWGVFEGRFSAVTRRYVQRRAWRYFRKLAWRDGPRFVTALARALALYPEDTSADAGKLVDAWGLVHALYWGSKVLERTPRGVVVAPGQSLAKLEPAPYKPELWKERFDTLFTLYLDASCNTVRQWSLAMMRAQHAAQLRALPLEKVRQLLRHSSTEAQAFGAELLQSVQGLESLPITEWMQLLELPSLDAVTLVVKLVEKHVTPGRLTLAQCITLARAQVAPVAELGLKWAKDRKVTEADLDALLGLADARVKSVREEGASWLASLIQLNEGAKMPERVRALLDSNHADVRAHALAVMAQDKRFGDAPLLWAAMSESPWPEVREALVAQLPQRQSAYSADTLRWIWAASLLAIHRGGRARAAVPRQVADRVVKHPEEAHALLPLLGLALRSVRPPERRAALAALSTAALRAPALRTAVETLLPELKLVGERAWA